MPLGTEIGPGPGDIVLDGQPAPPTKKKAQHPPVSAHVFCGQTVGWIKMKHDMDVGLGPDHIVLYKDPAPHERGTSAPPHFSTHA